MSRWKKQPPYKGTIHQGCLNCPPVESIARMDMLIAVGFGCAQVTKDGELIYDEIRDIHHAKEDREVPALSEFEAMAKADPNHDWRVILEAPLRGRTYQRHENDKWVLIDSNQGFA